MEERMKAMPIKILFLILAVLLSPAVLFADDLLTIKIFHIGDIPRNMPSVEQRGHDISLIDLRELSDIEDQITQEASRYLSVNIKEKEIAKILEIGASKSEEINYAWENRLLAQELGVTDLSKLPAAVFVTKDRRRWIWYGKDLWDGYRTWQRNN